MEFIIDGIRVTLTGPPKDMSTEQEAVASD